MGTITLPPVVTPAVLRAVEASMQRCWLELERAERQGAAASVREQLYDAYLRAYAVYQEAERRVQEGG